jgi:3-phytase
MNLSTLNGAARLAASVLLFAGAVAEDPIVLRPKAVLETQPVPNQGDSADDPAVWVHPTDPAQSLVLGTDKNGGLLVFDLEGVLLQVVSDGARPNNVDVIYDFPLNGNPVDLAVAGVRKPEGFGVAIWVIDPDKRMLTELGAVPSFSTFGGGEPYGSCVYRSPLDGSQFVFVTNKIGKVEQYRLESTTQGTVKATLARTISVGTQVEGCVADPYHQKLYVAEEDVGIWCYDAEPSSKQPRRSVARVGEHGLKADLEGLALYRASGGKGYLIASVQGNSTFAVFERDGENSFVATIDPASGSVEDVGDTDGLDVINMPTSPRFPRGLLVVQDGIARNGRQNFKLFSWADVASDRLRVDTSNPVRPIPTHSEK